jgi:eukaryotic-like serine/threonine-protein kinase
MKSLKPFLLLSFLCILFSCKKEETDPIDNSQSTTNSKNLGTVYFGGYDKKVYALDAATGDKKWEFLAGDNFQSSPAYADGVLYVTCYDKKVYALDAKTGSKLWEFATNWFFTNGSPSVANGIVYVPSDYLYALDAKTGKEIWKYRDHKDSYEFQASPTVVDGVVYCSSRGCAFNAGPSALDAKTGAMIWHRSMCVTESSPMVAGNSVYYGNETDGLYSFNKVTGEQNWFFDAKDFITTTSPTFSDGLVFIGTWDNNLYAIDAATGKQKWAFDTKGWINSSPIISDGFIFFGSNHKGMVYALDAKSGSKKWEFQTGEFDNVESSPVIANGIVYIGSNDKNIYALDAKSGAKKWSFPTGRGLGTASAIVVDQNGKVFYNGLSGMAQ